MKISSYGVCQDVNDDAVRRALDRAMQIGIFHPGERGAVRDDDWAGADHMVGIFRAVIFDEDAARLSLIVCALQNIAGGQRYGLSLCAHLRVHSVRQDLALKIRAVRRAREHDHAGGMPGPVYFHEIVQRYLHSQNFLHIFHPDKNLRFPLQRHFFLPNCPLADMMKSYTEEGHFVKKRS